MKTSLRFVRSASLSALVALALGMPMAGAQSNRSLARATVPFAFQYGTRSFPAGKYNFGMISANIMAVHGASGTALGMVQWDEADTQGRNGKLVFHRDGDRYVLRDIWLPQLSAHLLCPQARQHRHREVAEIAKPASPDVEVALLDMPR